MTKLYVLVVEDDPTSAAVLRAFLSKHGEVAHVRDGAAALDAYRMSQASGGRPFDAIFLDVMMPVMSGRDVLNAIRAEEVKLSASEPVKIVMTTALNDPETVLGSFRSGCEAYLVKPVTEQEIVRTLVDLGLICPAPQC